MLIRSVSFALAIDSGPSERRPLFVRISEAIARDIARGRLRPSDALPGSRTLAATLGVHRSTVVSAYAELASQGWIETRAGAATCVAAARVEITGRRISAHADRRVHVPRRTGFGVGPMPVRIPRLAAVMPGAIAMWGGIPDSRLVPVDLLARAYRRAARHHGRKLLGYTWDARGYRPLRVALAAQVSTTRGLAADADSVMVTRGSQMALDLLARSLIEPGDTVAVEALGYASAFRVFERAGAKLAPIAVDRHGIRVDALSRTPRVRAVYLTPHHQYPTTVALSPSRRLALLDWARRERVAIIEDDYDQEFHYDGRPILPLASADSHGNVVYVGTLAKILAPGLRLGFVVAPEPLLARMSDERTLVDRQGDALLECAVADLFEDGEIQRHVRRARRIYHARRDALCHAVDTQFGDVLSYQRPHGGLALWAAVDSDVDIDRWHERAVERGVHFQTGRQFTLDGSAVQAIRLGYAMIDDRELAIAMRRLKGALPRGGLTPAARVAKMGRLAPR